MTILKTIAVLATTMIVLVSPVQAIPVLWHIDYSQPAGSVVDELTGSFVYDADTGFYSDINVTATGTSSTVNTTYLFEGGGLGVSYNAFGTAILSNFTDSNAANRTDSLHLQLAFAGAGLTNAGGIVGIDQLFTGLCVNFNCSGSNVNNPVGGSSFVFSAPVEPMPEPGTLALLMLGVVGVGWSLRRSTRS